MTMASDLGSELSRADVSLLLQPHSAYDLDEIARRSDLVFDTRGVMRHPNVERL